GVCFQAEDGIRYSSVTGVQTCALPISLARLLLLLQALRVVGPLVLEVQDALLVDRILGLEVQFVARLALAEQGDGVADLPLQAEIGRASCRERGQMRWVEDGASRRVGW